MFEQLRSKANTYSAFEDIFFQDSFELYWNYASSNTRERNSVEIENESFEELSTLETLLENPVQHGIPILETFTVDTFDFFV